jgi:hypothetical protein
MQETFQNPETAPEQPKMSLVTILLTAAVALAVAASAWLVWEPTARRQAGSGPEAQSLKMTSAEREYLKNIQVSSLTLSRAENFLHQQVTILNGEVYNAGSQPVSSLRLTTTFLDDMNQIVLRETRAVLGSPEQPLAPGARRSFEISFDHVPNSWNMQQPSVGAAYLQLPRL